MSTLYFECARGGGGGGGVGGRGVIHKVQNPNLNFALGMSHPQQAYVK